MKVVSVCSICKKEYCYNPKWEPECKDICQECYEFQNQRRGCSINRI